MKNIIIALLCIASCLSGAEYDIVLLAPSDKPLGDSSYGNLKIDENGHVIGSLRDLGAFIYHESFGFRLIDSLGNEFMQADAVNAQGNVVGRLHPRFGVYGFDDHIFFYDHKTRETIDLMLDPQFKEFNSGNTILSFSDDNQLILHNEYTGTTFAYGIPQKQLNFEIKQDVLKGNNKGQLIGGSRRGDTEAPAWFFDPSAGYSDLGSLDIFQRWSVYPEVLSDTGYVAGTGEDSQRDTKGFVWSPSEGLQSFNTLGGDYISVLAINNQGHVVGDSTRKDRREHPFLYTPERGIIDLGTIGGGKEGYAWGLNDYDQVVGWSLDSSHNHRAFIWDSNHGIRDLYKLIPTNTGWKELNMASGINNQGYIVGVGIYYGEEHAFLLIPKK